MPSSSKFSDVIWNICEEKDLDPEQLIRGAVNFFTQFTDDKKPAESQQVVVDLTGGSVPSLTAVDTAGRMRQISRASLYPDVKTVTKM